MRKARAKATAKEPLRIPSYMAMEVIREIAKAV
jgi:hypothetical protein